MRAERRLLTGLLARLLAGQAGLPLLTAQMTTSGAEDAGVLLEAKS